MNGTLSPELLAERDEQCEDYCGVLEQYGLIAHEPCPCESATFDDKHQLCIEESIETLECLASCWGGGGSSGRGMMRGRRA